MLSLNRCLLLACLLNLLWLVAQGTADPFQVGAAKAQITPNPLLPVSGGMGPPAPARQKRGELMARAMVVRKGTTTVAIVSVDLLGFPSVLCDRVRAKVAQIPPEQILIGATHTHSAPDAYAFPDGQGGHTADLKYLDFVCEQTAAAIRQAFESLQPAALRIGTAKTTRRIAYNYYAPDLYDREMSVIQAVDSAGRGIATLVNFAVHPEVLGNRLGIVSPDLVGPMCDRLEQDYGGTALFMNGAIGGMVTADNRDLERIKDARRGYWHDLRTWDECLRIGNAMAAEAREILEQTKLQQDPPLACKTVKVKLPVESDVIWAVVENSPLNYPRNSDRTVTTQINLVTLGDAQLLTIPGEAMPNIGLYLKRKMKAKHRLLLGLTNDAFGYILTEVDFNSFDRYDYVSATSLGEMTGEILIEKWRELLEQANAP
ncbi:MAG: hypothetical protein P8N76_04960 [Pirellulaceae bacterium]|nr:hypothetical protein [Pirellulaceae bacterium]